MTTELRFQPDQSSLRRVRGEVREAAARLGAAERVCDTAALVVDELGNNAIEHGVSYRASGHQLVIGLRAVATGFEIEFRDPEMPADVVQELASALGAATVTPALDSERGRGLFLLSIYLGELRIELHKLGGLRLRGVIAAE